MPRETISINISSNPCYEAGAAFLAALAYPAADQEPQRSDLWLALCRQTIIALANENFEGWSWQHQPIKPGFFIVSDDTAEKTCRDGFDLINDRLLAEAKVLAAQQRTSLTRVIEEGLQLRLHANATAAPRRRARLPVYKGRGGLVAGVDPLSNRALLEALGDDA